jgi:hypothetical protein
MAVAMAVGMAGAMATDTAIRTTGTARTAAGGGPYGYGGYPGAWGAPYGYAPPAAAPAAPAAKSE